MRLHEAPPARGLVPTLTLATFVNHLNVIVAACLEHAGVWAMWTYYEAFYVQQRPGRYRFHPIAQQAIAGLL